ncbi:GAF and ANTAR domain-containing protein [Kribbella sp. NPDC005582]|uniref:GAF and ANTAR domain-containing protein n=1 Tax=Kribbella sp. NPDC005582 TaxID=3156893 RepID=UPI0033BC8C4E
MFATDPVTGNNTAADFARLALELHNLDGVEETVEAVVEFALQALSCSYAGLALWASRSAPEIAAVTDPVVADIYEVQLGSGEGPLITSLESRTTVLVPDTLSEERWPGWAAKVAALGVRSVLDVPLISSVPGTGPVGVLGLYSPEPDAFGPDDEAVAHILARHAMVAVGTARHQANLTQAVDARKLVGQAMGILMERFDISPDQAFAVLRRYSQDTNTKLRDVAAELIDTRRLPR